MLLSAAPVAPQMEAPIVPEAANSIQIITPTPSTQAAAPNAPVSVRVDYSTNPSEPNLAGLALKLHYNSQQLLFSSVTNVLDTFLDGDPNVPPAQRIVDALDQFNDDGDATTDRVLSAFWIDNDGTSTPPDNWPGVPGSRSSRRTSRRRLTSPGRPSSSAGLAQGEMPIRPRRTSIRRRRRL